ncbi:MAG TPA: hypothetical protein VNO87_01340 [Methylomirabilota bacterium]|nr:hypothetical protein [Methylomirabilota bacterium]
MSEGPAGLERLDAGAHLAATPLPAESLQAGPGNCRRRVDTRPAGLGTLRRIAGSRSCI